IKQALEGEPVGEITRRHLDRCLACRACETTCPSGVEYHRLYEIGRQVVARQAPRPASQRAVRAAIRWAAAWPDRMKRLMARGGARPGAGAGGIAAGGLTATRRAAGGGARALHVAARSALARARRPVTGAAGVPAPAGGGCASVLWLRRGVLATAAGVRGEAP